MKVKVYRASFDVVLEDNKTEINKATIRTAVKSKFGTSKIVSILETNVVDV